MDTSSENHSQEPEAILKLVKDAIGTCRDSSSKLCGFARGIEIGISTLQGSQPTASNSIHPLRERSFRLSSFRDDYRLTQLAGAAPTLSVAEYLQCSRSTAARWIRAARDEGLLGPAIYGKAGERPKPRRRKKS